MADETEPKQRSNKAKDANTNRYTKGPDKAKNEASPGWFLLGSGLAQRAADAIKKRRVNPADEIEE